MMDIVSIGQAATWLQTSVTRVRDTAAQLGIEPAARINGVDHYSAVDVDRIGASMLTPQQAGVR